MKRPEISFRVIGNSGPLSIYIHKGPYGDAIDSTSGKGVGWFSPLGDLLGVEFDDVEYECDSQELIFSNGASLLIKVNQGVVKVVKIVEAIKNEAV